MRGITLIGMPASGKSTIGKKLAGHLDWNFLDLDILIQEQESKPLADFIKEKGEEVFLQSEEKCALGLDFAKTVFAPGGSIIYCPRAMEKIRLETAIFYLELPLAEIQKRLADNWQSRGIIGIKEKGLETLFQERTAFYQKYADFKIFCLGKSEEEIIEKIALTLKVEKF